MALPCHFGEKGVLFQVIKFNTVQPKHLFNMLTDAGGGENSFFACFSAFSEKQRLFLRYKIGRKARNLLVFSLFGPGGDFFQKEAFFQAFS